MSVSETADVYFVGAPSGRKPAPALLWMHGGGMVVGTAVSEFSLTQKRYSPHMDVAMAFVEYRLAPKHPFPAAMDDCAAALAWLADQPDVDPSRIAIGGGSAGGGLAAGLALRARDEMDVKPVFQMLIYPMIDDRTAQRTDLDDMPVKLWNQTCNRFGWSSYLAGATGDDVHPHAAPSTRELWLWLAADGEVEAGCLPFGLVSLGLAFGDLPGDPSGDITAGWGRTQRIDVVGGCRSGMVDSGDLGRTAVERSGEAIEGIVATLVGEVGALLISGFGVGEVEGVGLPDRGSSPRRPIPGRWSRRRSRRCGRW